MIDFFELISEVIVPLDRTSILICFCYGWRGFRELTRFVHARLGLNLAPDRDVCDVDALIHLLR